MSAVASIRRHPRGGYTWMYWEDWSTTTPPEPGDAAIRYDTIDQAMTAAGIPCVLHYELWPDVMQESNPEPDDPIRLYVAAPMRRRPGFNVEAMDKASSALRAQGYEVFNPAEHDRSQGFDFAGKTGFEDLTEQGFDLNATLAYDLDKVTRWADGIALLPGWDESYGVRAELAAAAAVGKFATELDENFEPTGFAPAERLLEDWVGETITIPVVTGEVRVTSDTGGQKGWRTPRPTHSVNQVDLAWVAGLVEGEGSFYLREGPYPAARFQLNMTDQDVVERACRIMQVGNVRPHKPGPRSVKPQWRWRVTAQAEVAWIMDVLEPYMGERRSAKIRELREVIPAWAVA